MTDLATVEENPNTLPRICTKDSRGIPGINVSDSETLEHGEPGYCYQNGRTILCSNSLYDSVTDVTFDSNDKKAAVGCTISQHLDDNFNQMVTSEDELLLSYSGLLDSLLERSIRSSRSETSEAVVTRTYYRRFWILFVFSFYSFATTVQWNTWGPISDSVMAAFPNWTYETVAWMEISGIISFLLFTLPMSYFVARMSLRTVFLLATGIFAVSLAIRCFTSHPASFMLLSHLSSFASGISTTFLASPSVVTTVWFPPAERTTATAIVMAASQLGSVGSYLEPLLVHQPDESVPLSLIKGDIMLLMYIMAVAALVNFIMVACYFPSKPPHPPSVATSIERLRFRTSFYAVLRDGNLRMLIVVFGVCSGPSQGWIGMLNYSLEPLGFDQNEAMKVGLIAIISCSAMSVATGYITDRIFGYLKETIIGFLLVASFSFYWFWLLSYKVIAVTEWQVYVSVASSLSFQYGTVSLFYELATEMAYPAPEVIVGGLVACSSCLSTTLFLLVYTIKDIGYIWVTYVLVSSVAVPVVPLLCIKVVYRRSKLDRGLERDYKV